MSSEVRGSNLTEPQEEVKEDELGVTVWESDWWLSASSVVEVSDLVIDWISALPEGIAMLVGRSALPVRTALPVERSAFLGGTALPVEGSAFLGWTAFLGGTALPVGESVLLGGGISLPVRSGDDLPVVGAGDLTEEVENSFSGSGGGLPISHTIRMLSS